MSPRLSCVVRTGPLKELNAGQRDWSPRRFVGQSTARIIRVTSPVCRGAHVSDRTSIPVKPDTIYELEAIKERLIRAGATILHIDPITNEASPQTDESCRMRCT